MAKKDGVSRTSPLIVGISIVLAACICGCFLTTNTLLIGLIPGLRALEFKPFGDRCEVSEELIVPFKNGVNGAVTQQTYSGIVELTVSGTGQAAGTTYSDAFYLYEHRDGTPMLPEHPDEFILTINSELAHNYLVDDEIPTYNEDHIYTFEINAPGGPLLFGVMDGFAGDNSGSYEISICH